MATGGSSAEPEPLSALDIGPRALGPERRLLGKVRVGGGGSRPRAPGPWAPGPCGPKGLSSALEPPVAMYFHKKGMDI